MRDFRKRGKNEVGSFILLLVGLVLVLILVIFAVRGAWSMYVKFSVALRGNEASQKELAELKEAYEKMSAAVANLSTTRGEEGEIRDRFGVARPGEGAIEIVRSSTSSLEQEEKEGNVFMRILRSLFVWQ
jgi:cell division protein FtsB